jgi:hypothetical protein
MVTSGFMSFCTTDAILHARENDKHQTTTTHSATLLLQAYQQHAFIYYYRSKIIDVHALATVMAKFASQ